MCLFFSQEKRFLLVLSRPLAILLAPFRSVFTKPTWQKVMVFVEGALLTHGCRTVTAALPHERDESEIAKKP
jgi:hypothetical protein